MSNPLYDQFGTNKQLEREGVLVEYGENSHGQKIRFRIARMSSANVQYARLLNVRTKPFKRQFDTDTMDPTVAAGILREVFVDAVLKGWEGVEDRQGNSIAFSRENALKLFDELPDLYEDLRDQASKAAIFRDAVNQADAGN